MRRQAVHLSGVGFVALLVAFGPVASVLALAISLSSLVLGFYRSRIPVPRRLEPLLRFADRFERPGGFPYFGVFSFYFSVAAVSSLFPVWISSLSVTVLSVHDSVATLAGKMFGRTRIPFNPEKSVEGFLAGLVAGTAAAVLVSAVLGIDPRMALAASVSGAFIESLPHRVRRLRIDDNFTVAFGTSLVLFFLF